MNKEEMKILIEIIEKIIDRQNTICRKIALLEMQNMLLYKKIDFLKDRQSKRCCKCSK